DGRLPWSQPRPPVPASQPQAGSYSDGSMATDPADPRLVYSVVPTFVTPSGTTGTFRGTIVFTRSGDGGRHWGRARQIFDTGPGHLTTGDQIIALLGHQLAVVFTYIDDPLRHTLKIAAITSGDRGRTWSAPVTIASLG